MKIKSTYVFKSVFIFGWNVIITLASKQRRKLVVHFWVKLPPIHLSTTHGKDFNLFFFSTERQTEKLWILVFSFRFDLNGNRTHIYRYSSRLSIYLTIKPSFQHCFVRRTPVFRYLNLTAGAAYENSGWDRFVTITAKLDTSWSLWTLLALCATKIQIGLGTFLFALVSMTNDDVTH